VTQSEPDARPLDSLLRSVFPSGRTRVERVKEGVSTWVYRVVHRGSTFFLRILPEDGASYAPEVAVHDSLREMLVKVPEVIYFEHCYEPLQRSVMVVAEIPGRPLSQSTDLDMAALAGIFDEAGRDLARINSVPVEGFGWVQRDSDEQPGTLRLHAEAPTYRAFALEHWQVDMAYLAANVLSQQDITLLEHMLACYSSWLDDEESVLAHGDFDATAIYQEHGRYTGIIDFGEIRGANRWYDLGHSHMRDGEYLHVPLLPGLLRGYAESAPLPANVERRILLTSLLINVRALAHSLRKRRLSRFTLHQLEVLRADLAVLSS
jgi:aminoglycoside phosphotransferase (APT) family kinase protein